MALLKQTNTPTCLNAYNKIKHDLYSFNTDPVFGDADNPGSNGGVAPTGYNPGSYLKDAPFTLDLSGISTRLKRYGTFNPGSYSFLYTTTDPDPLTGSFCQNPINPDAAQLSYAQNIGNWNSGEWNAILISPRHLVSTKHWTSATNAVFNFVTKNGTIVSKNAIRVLDLTASAADNGDGIIWKITDLIDLSSHIDSGQLSCYNRFFDLNNAATLSFLRSSFNNSNVNLKPVGFQLDGNGRLIRGHASFNTVTPFLKFNIEVNSFPNIDSFQVNSFSEHNGDSGSPMFVFDKESNKTIYIGHRYGAECSHVVGANLIAVQAELRDNGGFTLTAINVNTIRLMNLNDFSVPNLQLLDNDLKNFSFITDDEEFISFASSPADNNSYAFEEFRGRKQEVVRSSFSGSLPVYTTVGDRITKYLSFFSLYADSRVDGIELPQGLLVGTLDTIHYYKNNNNGDGSFNDPWKMFYLRHVIMKARSVSTVDPLYSGFIDHNKLTVLNSTLAAAGKTQNISGFAGWLASNPNMDSTPPGPVPPITAPVFNPKILSFLPAQGGQLSDHEQVADSILPAIAGCIDGFLLDSLTFTRIKSAFSTDLFENSVSYALQFNSRRIIRSDFFNTRLGGWSVAWTGSDSVDDKDQMLEMGDDNALSMMMSFTNPIYDRCSCPNAGVPWENATPSSSSSSSYVSSSSSSSAGTSAPSDFLFSATTTRPQFGIRQPDWYRKSSFSLSVFLPYEWYRAIVAANLNNPSEIITESAMLDGLPSGGAGFGTDVVSPMNWSDPTYASNNWQFQSDQSSYLRRTESYPSESARIQAAYDHFVNPEAQMLKYKRYSPDMITFDVQNAFGNPLIWRSNVSPIGKTSASSYSQIIARYPTINWISPLVNAAHNNEMKCLAYLKPLFNFLNLSDYPAALGINGKTLKYVRYTNIARSIFSDNYKNYVKQIMSEVVSPQASGGLGFDGIYWDYSFCNDSLLDFSKDAIDVWAQSLGHGSGQDESYITWAFTNGNFPFPNPALTESVLQGSWMLSYGDKQGTALHDLVRAPDNVITATQKANLKKYTNVLIDKYKLILNELALAVESASSGNAVFLPMTEYQDWIERGEIGVNIDTSRYAQSVKTESCTEPRGFHRQRSRSSFYSQSDYTAGTAGGSCGGFGTPAFSVLAGTSSAEKVYADINRPDMASIINVNQKIDYCGGNKTTSSWHENCVPPAPTGGPGFSNNAATFNTDQFRPMPTRYVFGSSGIGGEDAVVGYLRGKYQICLKNSAIFDSTEFGNDGWIGDLPRSVNEYGEGYYNEYGAMLKPSHSFWRMMAYHQKKIKDTIADAGVIFTKKDLYAWAAIHISNKGRQGIQSEEKYMGDFAGGLRYIKQCKQTDLFGNTFWANSNISTGVNDKNQNWGEFYWPIFGSSEALESRFIPYSFVTDTHLSSIDDLRGLKLVIIPHREWLDDSQRSVLNSFANMGGSIVYLDDVFRNTAYSTGDPRLKGRFYDLESKPVEIQKLLNYITAHVGEPDFSGSVTSSEYDNSYKNKQASWYKISDYDYNNEFNIAVHLLNDMSWMDLRKHSSPYEIRFNELDPLTVPFNPSQNRALSGVMDYDLFGWGPDWRTQWYNTLTEDPLLEDNVEWPLPDPNGITTFSFYEPHPKTMWGRPLVGGYNGKYWDAELSLRLPAGMSISSVAKIFVDQENEPNDLGKYELGVSPSAPGPEAMSFIYDSTSESWKISVKGIGMHAMVAIKVKSSGVLRSFRDAFYSSKIMNRVQVDPILLPWNDSPLVTLFVGQPDPNMGERAFAWECDPADPLVSSPWHNLIYELIAEDYKWGARSFQFFQPYGNYDTTPTHPLVDRPTSLPSDYLMGGFFLSPKVWEKTWTDIPSGLASPNEVIIPVYDHTVGAGNAETKERLEALSKCPCRWKGFKQAINALIEGRLVPSVATGRTAISEPCKVSLYLPVMRGWVGYRYRSNLWWDKYFNESKSSNPSALFAIHAAYADRKFYQDIDSMIEDLVSMNGTIPGTENSLTVDMDTAVGAATPSILHLFRPSWMTEGSIETYTNNPSALGGLEDGQKDYRTDALELADWYVYNRLTELGISVAIETRPEKYRKASRIPTTTDGGLLFPDLINPRTAQSVPSASTGSERLGYTDPFGWIDEWIDKPVSATDRTFCKYETAHRLTGFFASIDEIPRYHRITFPPSFPPIEDILNGQISSSDVYGFKYDITNAGFTANVIELRPSTGYGPYYFLGALYPLVDCYKHSHNVINGAEGKLTGIVFDIPQIAYFETLFFKYGKTTLPIYNGVDNSYFKYWSLDQDFFEPNETFFNRIFDASKFSTAISSSNPNSYTGGLWTVEGKAFWNSEIRKHSFDDFIGMLHSVASNGAPKGSEDQGWNGDIYPNDFYSKNVISDAIFGTQAPLALDGVRPFGRSVLPEFQDSNFALHYQFSVFDAVLWYERYIWKIPGHKSGGTQSAPYLNFSVCTLKDLSPGCESSVQDGVFYKRYAINGYQPPGWVFNDADGNGGDANASTLASIRADFRAYIDIDAIVRGMAKHNPDFATVFIHSGPEPLWWPTSIPGLVQFPLFADDGTGPDAIGLAFNALAEYKAASNKYKQKLIGYFFPFSWIELNATDYPLTINIVGQLIKEGRFGPYIGFTSIFKGSGINMDFVNHLVNVFSEFAELGMDNDTGYGFRGAYWDSSPIYYALDFSPAAKAASGIDVSSDFPWPISATSTLYAFFQIQETYNGNVASLILRELNPNAGWTAAVRNKLEQYIYAMREKEAEFFRLVRQGLDARGHEDLLLLPAVVNSYGSFELPMNSEYLMPWTQGSKTEIGIEQYLNRIQPTGISTASGSDSLPDFWLALYYDLLSTGGINGKRQLGWQAPKWLQLTIEGSPCAQQYYTCAAAYGPVVNFIANVDSLGVIPRDIAVRGWHENQSLLVLAAHTTIEHHYGFYNWHRWDNPEDLEGFENIGEGFAIQHLPYLRKIASVLSSIKSCKMQLSGRSTATWCVILTKPEYLWKGGNYPAGNAGTHFARHWPIIGALHTCVEHGIPHTIAHDRNFRAADYANAAVILVPFPASILPSSIQHELDIFDGLVIFMDAEYSVTVPTLENNFHNTTIDTSTGKTRAQISRDKLWARIISSGANVVVSTAIEKPSYLPESPAPITSYEIGDDVFGNQAINAIMLADAAWHDPRKNYFFSLGNAQIPSGGSCAVQNLLYSNPIDVTGVVIPVKVESVGYRRIFDTCPCSDGINGDCYYLDYTALGAIPIGVLPARGKLIYYAGYPPTWGNTRSAIMNFNARQKPHRFRQLLLNHDSGRMDPIDIMVDTPVFSVVPFEQGTIVQVQLKEDSDQLPNPGICIVDDAFGHYDSSRFLEFIGSLVDSIGSLVDSIGVDKVIVVRLKCASITTELYIDALSLFTELQTDISANPESYSWIDACGNLLMQGSDDIPISMIVKYASGECPGVGILAIQFQNDGIEIAKRITSLAVHASSLSSTSVHCSNFTIGTSEVTVGPIDMNFGLSTWEPLIESSLFENSPDGRKMVLSIKPVIDVNNNYFNIDADGMPIAKGMIKYISDIDIAIGIHTQGAKGIEDYYAGIVIDFPDTFSVDAPHPSYCDHPNTIETSGSNAYNDARRAIANVNGAFIYAINQIRVYFDIDISVKGVGDFGNGLSFQASRSDSTEFNMSNATSLVIDGLHDRISESYGSILENCDFVQLKDGYLESAAIEEWATGVSGCTKISDWIHDAANGIAGLDIVTIGDSNQNFNGTGWTDGLMHALLEAGAIMYATPLAPSALVNGVEIGYKCRYVATGITGSLGSFASGRAVGPSTLTTSYTSGTGSLQPWGPNASNPVTLDYPWLRLGTTVLGSNGWVLDSDNPLTVASASEQLIFRLGHGKQISGGSFSMRWANQSAPTTAIASTSVDTRAGGATLWAWGRTSLSLSTASSTGAIGAYFSGANGPVGFGWSSVYRLKKGVAINCLNWHSGASISALAADITGAGSTVIAAYLREISLRQTQATQAAATQRICILVNAGFCVNCSQNDYNLWMTNFAAIRTTITDAWISLGNLERDITFISMVSHQNVNPDASKILREASENFSATNLNTTHIDLSRIIKWQDIVGYHDDSGPTNLTTAGYNAVSVEIVNSILAARDSRMERSKDLILAGGIRNHFIDRNGSCPQLYKEVKRTPLWTATWRKTDHRVDVNPVAEDNIGGFIYGDVNLYDYVKPMSSLQDAAGAGGFHDSDPVIFTTRGLDWAPGRFASLVTIIKNLPKGMRCLNMSRYNQGHMYENPIDRFETGEQSPYAIGDIATMYNDWSIVGQAFKDAGGIPDYFALDCEQWGHWSYWSLGTTLSPTQVDSISSSVYFSAEWFDSPSAQYMFNYNGKYTNSIADIKIESGQHAQTNRDYLYWNQAMGSIHAEILKQSIVRATHEIFGNYNISNYDGIAIRDWDETYDYQGHPQPYRNIVGNASSPVLYAGFNSEICGIKSSDHTRIIRTNAGETIPIVSNSWFQTLNMIQTIRAAKRAAPRLPMRPWIASVNWADTVMGYNAQWLIDGYGPGMYNESIRHFALTGVEMFLLWNGSGDDTALKVQQSMERLEGIMIDLNSRLGGWTIDTLTPERIDYTASYIISGAPAADNTFLWRVTKNPTLAGSSLRDDNESVVTLDSDGGAWIVTTTHKRPIFTVS